MTKNNKLKIAAVGDLHVHKNAVGIYKTLFQEIGKNADVVLLCGDLTNLGTIEEADVLADDLKDLRMPVLAVLGNHDHHSDQDQVLRDRLKKVQVKFLEEEPFELEEVGFAGAKGFGGGFGQRVVAGFGEVATKAFVRASVEECLRLENQLATLQTKYKIAVLHYSPIAETLVGEPPQIHAFLGTSRLADSIDRFDVTAVFHGHAHHGQLEGKTPKGARVFNCAYTVLKQNNMEYYMFELDKLEK